MRQHSPEACEASVPQALRRPDPAYRFRVLVLVGAIGQLGSCAGYAGYMTHQSLLR
jgi:hypothetical protein